MKNIDKLRAMSAEDLAYYLDCKCCIYDKDPCGNACITGQTAWLNQEVNPMPKLEVGDVVKTEYGEYVVIDDNKVVNPTTMKRTIFNNICVTTRFIYRYSEDEYKEIWSVNND